MKRHKILVIEDNPSNMELFIELTGMLENTAVIPASDGATGIELARKELPGLILLDIQLPGTDGVAILKQIKNDKLTSSIPVIALTAYAMKGDTERFLSEGFDDYISKPVNVEGFLKTVKLYLKD